MPINIPDDLPAYKVLTDENIFVMNQTRATTQRIRPLKILIVNIMPLKITTETQLLRLLSNTPLQLEVELIHMSTHDSKNVPKEHLLTFYWNELCEILEWAKTHVFSSFFICWASQAALHYYYGIDKYLLKHKLTGVYRHHTNQRKMRRKILRGFDYQFYAPHSRYTTVLKEDVASNSNLDILAESDAAGVYLVASKDGSQFFVTGHPEYDPDTLDKEYKRDKEKPDVIAELPKNYYLDDDPSQEIQVKWRSHA